MDCTNRDNKDVHLKLKKKMICDYDKFVSPNQDGPINVVFNAILKKFNFVSFKTSFYPANHAKCGKLCYDL